MWNNKATKSFSTVNKAMLAVLVLCFLGFSLIFMVEIDVSRARIGAILVLEEHLIAYYNKKLIGRRKLSSMYARELFAITQVVGKWRPLSLGETLYH